MIFANHIAVLFGFALYSAYHFSSMDGYKILHFPVPAKSHVIVFGRFAEALANQGHTAHLLLPNHTKPGHEMDRSRVNVIFFPVTLNETWADSWEASEMETRLIELSEMNIFQWIYEGAGIISHGLHHSNLECEELLNSSEAISQLESEKYDLIVLDSAHLALCTPLLAYKLGVPVVILSTSNNEWFYRFPHSSAMPSIITPSTDVMTFMERLRSFIIDVAEHVTLNPTTYYAEKYVPEKPPISGLDICQNALFIFGLYDPVLIYPRPMMPNTIDIGDLMLRPGRPLAGEYVNILNATGGVIVMSLGSLVHTLPDRVLRQFCNAFRNLDPTIVLIWQTHQNSNCDLPKNIIFKRWIPFNDILAHPNMKLLITHAGLNSYVEAVNHGKPMIAFPLSLDRPRYAVSMEHKGMGMRMEILSFTDKELSRNIHEILTNGSYRETALKIGERMRNRYAEPVDKRIAFWVEHVLKYGGEHLRSGTYKLSLVEFLMIDVYLFLLFITVTLVALAIIVLIQCVQCVNKGIIKKSRKLKKH